MLPVARAGHDVDVLCGTQARQVVIVVQIWQILHGRIEIHVLVVVALGVCTQVVAAAHCDHAVQQIRAFEIQIRRVQCPQRRAGDDNRRILAGRVFNKRNNFVVNVFVELHMPDRLVARVHLIIEPAFAVDAVDRKDLHFARIDVGANGIDEVETLVFQVIRCRRWQE